MKVVHGAHHHHHRHAAPHAPKRISAILLRVSVLLEICVASTCWCWTATTTTRYSRFRQRHDYRSRSSETGIGRRANTRFVTLGRGGDTGIPATAATPANRGSPATVGPTRLPRRAQPDERNGGGGRTEEERQRAALVAPPLSTTTTTRRRWFSGVSGTIASSVLAAGSWTPSSSAAVAGVARAPSVVSTAATCDPTVAVWKHRDRLVYLLGTAHISSVSADLAGQLVKDVHPNAVFVELDVKRVSGIVQKQPAASSSESLPSSTSTNNENGEAIDAGDGTGNVKKSRLLVPAVSSTYASSAPGTSDRLLIGDDRSSSSVGGDDSMPTTTTKRRGGGGTGLFGFGGFSFGDPVSLGAAAVGNAIRGMYRNLNQAGFEPGQEFMSAVQEGRAIGADIVLGDRDVEVTLRRLTQALAVTDFQKLMDQNNELEQSLREVMPSGGGGGVGSDPTSAAIAPATSPGSPEQFKQEMTSFVESIKTRDKVTKIMTQLRELAPALVQVMLDERDAYMAAGLDTLNQYTVIVAVMGIAHLDGVENNLRSLGWDQVRPRC